MTDKKNNRQPETSLRQDRCKFIRSIFYRIPTKEEKENDARLSKRMQRDRMYLDIAYWIITLLFLLGPSACLAYVISYYR